jgi:hypothetical protein
LTQSSMFMTGESGELRRYLLSSLLARHSEREITSMTVVRWDQLR